jgi:hypothetical protein
MIKLNQKSKSFSSSCSSILKSSLSWISSVTLKEFLGLILLEMLFYILKWLNPISRTDLALRYGNDALIFIYYINGSGNFYSKLITASGELIKYFAYVTFLPIVQVITFELLLTGPYLVFFCLLRYKNTSSDCTSSPM